MVKKSQKRAQELLATEEQKAKDEIDEIVKLKKRYDEMSEEEKKAAKEKADKDKKTNAANEARAAIDAATLK